MENMDNGAVRRPNPRRRPPEKKKLNPKFLLAVGVAAVLIVLFIIFAVGSINRANEKRELARQESLAESSSLAQQMLEWEQEAQALIKEAEQYAASCEFEKAIEVLDKFSGNADDFSGLAACRQKYEDAESKLVAWEDVTKVPFLSFSKLFADPDKAFAGSGGDDARYYNISTAEFTAILTELYNNGYMLVDMDDLFTTGSAEDGTTLITQNQLRLPEGKKPVVLIHCQPDGYENQLVVENGEIVSKVTPKEGQSYTGSYDFVPLLEDFIEEHPGFSFRGARAVLAVTGHKGLFGYELAETNNIQTIVQALKDKGYTLASNTYGNVRYGKMDIMEMQDDLAKWESEIKPLLGETEILVYARSSDISDGKEAYTSKKYDKLYVSGFRYFMGLCYNKNPWMSITDNTIRMGRLMVTGGNLKDKPAMFEDLFDTTKVYGAK